MHPCSQLLFNSTSEILACVSKYGPKALKFVSKWNEIFPVLVHCLYWTRRVQCISFRFIFRLPRFSKTFLMQRNLTRIRNVSTSHWTAALCQSEAETEKPIFTGNNSNKYYQVVYNAFETEIIVLGSSTSRIFSPNKKTRPWCKEVALHFYKTNYDAIPGVRENSEKNIRFSLGRLLKNSTVKVDQPNADFA